jgi:ATP-dependent DNA helicase DinG
MLNKFVVIDLETTGNVPKRGDRIIQFAAVIIENGQITNQYSSLVNPQKPIPIFIEELTGINDDMVKDAPEFKDIAHEVDALLEDAYFVAHNVLFDLSFLQEELIQAGFEGFFGPVLDTVEMARILFPTADGYKLSELAEQENLSHERPHQADSDAYVTAELFLLLLNRIDKLPKKTLQQLTHLAGGLKSDLQQLLDEIMLEKSGEPELLPHSYQYVQNLALKKLPAEILEEDNDGKIQYPLANEAKLALLKMGIQGIEKRTGQFKMMDSVYESLQSRCHALIEAGTGVGKSLGYLLPTAFFAKQSNNKVVISTHTIQLQEQLMKNEIPLLNKMLPFKIKTVLIKGRNNYISLERLLQTLSDENDNYDTTLSKMQVLVWLTETETGDKDELNLSSGGHIYWNRIKNDASLFVQNSQWQEHDFYLRAQRSAKDAEMIITNHSLLLNDLSRESSILPEFKFCIVDEGHHFEKQASLIMGHSLDYLSTRLLLGQFGQFEQKQLFYQMEQIINSVCMAKDSLQHPFELNQITADLFYEMDDFFKLMMIYAKKMTAHKKGYYRTKVRFTIEKDGKEKAALLHSAERFLFLINDLSKAIRQRMNILEDHRDLLSDNQLGIVQDIVSFADDLEELQETVQGCFIRKSTDVKWIEYDSRSPQNVTTFFAQPAGVAETLNSKFFDKMRSVVITSATLTVNHSFSYIKKELGLMSVPVKEVSIPSPFVYKNQVRFFIPEDLPEINSVSLEEYVAAITEHIITIAEATKGRMLILFTAYDMLKQTYELIKESGYLGDYVMIAQGITSGSRTRLTRNFKRYEKAILFGTSSFWEGVDIPGEDLSCLVIVRLPFSPPDEPFTEAKCQLITQQGGNAFSDYSLPEAVLRFKQGFGRLIRTETDRGVMIVFDKRIVTTKYGRHFLNSVPEVHVKKGNIDEIVEDIVTWL